MNDFVAMLREAREQHPEENEEQWLERVRYRRRALFKVGPRERPAGKLGRFWAWIAGLGRCP